MKKNAETIEQPKAEDIVEKKQMQIADKGEAALYAKALATQEEMRRCKEKFVTIDHVDQYTKLRQIYAPETLSNTDPNGRVITPTKHEYFGLPDEMEQDVANGYVPVFNEKGYIVRGPDNMPLYTIDADIWNARQEAFMQESRSRLAGVQEIGKTSKVAPDQPMPTEKDMRGAKYIDAVNERKDREVKLISGDE